MNKESAMVGLLIKIKNGIVKKNYGYHGIFDEGKVYKIKSIKGSRVSVIDPDNNRIVGDILCSQIDMTSREDLADTMSVQAQEMIDRAKLLLKKSERLKKFESDEEEISSMIWACIDQKMTPKQIMEYLSENNVVIKFKE